MDEFRSVIGTVATAVGVSAFLMSAVFTGLAKLSKHAVKARAYMYKACLSMIAAHFGGAVAIFLSDLSRVTGAIMIFAMFIVALRFYHHALNLKGYGS